MIGSYSSALVTGASSGIGRAIAKALRQAGLEVFALGRNEKALAALETECGAKPIVLDMRDKEGLATFFAEHPVDVVINNAGVLTTRAPFQEIGADDIDAMIDINLKAPLHLARLAVPGMVERKRGHMFFIGSSAGRYPHPNMSIYGTSKAGISMFCDALRCDLHSTGVRVSEIAPGRVKTELYFDLMGAAQAQAELYDGYRLIAPEDIATLIITALTLPEHVDVVRMEVFPTAQTVGGGRMAKD